LVSALGSSLAEHLDGLLRPSENSPLTFSSEWVKGKNRAFGAVNRPLRPFPDHLSAEHRSRNNQLLWDALAQIEPQIQAVLSRYGADRIGVVIGTSVGGADENIPLFQHVANGGGWADIPFKQQAQLLSSPADFAAAAYGLQGACYGVSTACTSGARALISAARLLRLGVCDAVVCGGVDTLSPLTINGFASLEVLSDGIANPFSRNRNGINIGLPLLEIGDDVEKISAGDRLRVDTATGAIENLTTGDTFRAHPLPGFVQEIAQAGGLLNYIRENGGFRHGV